MEELTKDGDNGGDRKPEDAAVGDVIVQQGNGSVVSNRKGRKRCSKKPVMSDFEYNVDLIESENDDKTNDQAGSNNTLEQPQKVTQNGKATGETNSIDEGAPIKRPLRKKATEKHYEEQSDDEPLVKVAAKAQVRKPKDQYYSDDEYVPGAKDAPKSVTTSSDSAIDEDKDLKAEVPQKINRRRKKTTTVSPVKTEGTPRKRGRPAKKKVVPKNKELKPSEGEDPKPCKELVTVDGSNQVTLDSDSDIEKCLESSTITVKPVEPVKENGTKEPLTPSTPKKLIPTSDMGKEFENFLATSKISKELKIKKVTSCNKDLAKVALDIPVLCPQEVKKLVETSSQTDAVKSKSSYVQTNSSYSIKMKDTVPLTTEQSQQACDFMKGILKTTTELGTLMCEKSDEFIQKKINTTHVKDTMKMHYCIQKAFLLFKLAKDNLSTMEESLEKQYELFLSSNQLNSAIESVKKIIPEVKETNSDSDCEIIEETSLQPKKETFNPKTVFLNKELSIKIAKKPTVVEQPVPNTSQEIKLQGRHAVWINKSIMVKKVKPTPSFLAQDSRFKIPPDSYITDEWMRDFFDDYYRKKSIYCEPYTSLEWLDLNGNYETICNYFFVNKPVNESNPNDGDSCSEDDGFFDGTTSNENIHYESNQRYNFVGTSEIVDSSRDNHQPPARCPKTLFKICFDTLQQHFVSSDSTSSKNNAPCILQISHRSDNFSRELKPLTLFKLCVSQISIIFNLKQGAVYEQKEIENLEKNNIVINPKLLKTLCLNEWLRITHQPLYPQKSSADQIKQYSNCSWFKNQDRLESEITDLKTNCLSLKKTCYNKIKLLTTPTFIDTPATGFNCAINEQPESAYAKNISGCVKIKCHDLIHGSEFNDHDLKASKPINNKLWNHSSQTEIALFSQGPYKQPNTRLVLKGRKKDFSVTSIEVSQLTPLSLLQLCLKCINCHRKNSSPQQVCKRLQTFIIMSLKKLCVDVINGELNKYTSSVPLLSVDKIPTPRSNISPFSFSDDENYDAEFGHSTDDYCQVESISLTLESTWDRQIKLKEFKSCFAPIIQESHTDHLPLTDESFMVTPSALVKTEPTDESSLLNNIIPNLKYENDQSSYEMVNIPDIPLNVKAELIADNCDENYDFYEDDNMLPQFPNSGAMTQQSFDQFVLTQKLMNNISFNSSFGLIPESKIKPKTKHEPDSDNENESVMSLLVPQASHPVPIENAKGRLMESTSSEEVTEKEGKKKKKTKKKRAKKKKNQADNTKVRKEYLNNQETPINKEIAILTRRMKDRIRYEEKNNESTDSETDVLYSLNVVEESNCKSDESSKEPATEKDLENHNIAKTQISRKIEDEPKISSDIQDKPNATSDSRSDIKLCDKQATNAESVLSSQTNDVKENVPAQLESDISTFTGFSKSEIKKYQKMVQDLNNKVTMQIKEELNETEKKELNNVQGIIAASEQKNTAQSTFSFKKDEPVELIQCEPVMPFFDRNENDDFNTSELKHQEVSTVDSKLSQICQVAMDKLPESFVQTYFKYMQIQNEAISKDPEIDRLTNMHTLHRSSLARVEMGHSVPQKKKIKTKEGISVDASSPAGSSHSDDENRAELSPSDEETIKPNINESQIPAKSIENILARDSLINDYRDTFSYFENDPNLQSIKEEIKQTVEMKMEVLENEGFISGPKSKRKWVAKRITSHPLILTADKILKKDLDLLHAPTVEERVEKVDKKVSPTKLRQKVAKSDSLPGDNKSGGESSSEEGKMWISTKEKLLKKMEKRNVTETSVDDTKRAKLVSEFITRRADRFPAKKNTRRRRCPKLKRLEKKRQLEYLSMAIHNQAVGEDNHDFQPAHAKSCNSYFKGRRNIRKVLNKKLLARSTVLANMEEAARKLRLNMKLTQLRELLGHEDSVDVLVINGEVCLEYGFTEQQPVVSVHAELTKDMKPHQCEGVKFMWDACFESLDKIAAGHPGGGCILAHCMGLGKTLQVLALLHTVLTHPGVDTRRVLVCCPLSTVLNWVDEINKWLGRVTHSIKVFELSKLKKTYQRACQLEDWFNEGGIFIVGYELFRSLTTINPLLDHVRPTLVKKITSALLNPGPDIVICDEGHLLKNDSSVLAVAMSRVRTRRRIVLTGTPMQNNLREYYCMVNFVKPNLLGTYSEFSNRFENPIMNGQHRDSSENDILLMKTRSHILHRVLEGCLQRQEVSVLYPYLPKKHEYTIFISLTKCQSDMYKHYLEHLSRKTKQSILKDFHVLQKIWTHPQVLHNFQVKGRDEPSTRAIKVEEDDLRRDDLTASEDIKPAVTEEWWLQYVQEGGMLDALNSSNKFQAVFKILDECVRLKDKLLIFSTSLFTMDSLEYFLKHINKWSLGQEYYRLDGSVPPEVRQKWCREFNAEHNVTTKLFLISTRAGSLGLNMTAANRVIILDTSWNPAHDIQSIFRVYRFGQKKDCFIYRLVSMGTMEQKIYERSVTKTAVACRVVDEQQIDRHYNMADLTELYSFDELGEGVAGGVAPAVRDVALLRVARALPALHAVHEHDSLLRDSCEQSLPEHERAAAWDQFQREQVHTEMEENLHKKEEETIVRRVYPDTSSAHTIEIEVPPKLEPILPDVVATSLLPRATCETMLPDTTTHTEKVVKRKTKKRKLDPHDPVLSQNDKMFALARRIADVLVQRNLLTVPTTSGLADIQASSTSKDQDNAAEYTKTIADILKDMETPVEAPPVLEVKTETKIDLNMPKVNTNKRQLKLDKRKKASAIEEDPVPSTSRAPIYVTRKQTKLSRSKVNAVVLSDDDECSLQIIKEELNRTVDLTTSKLEVPKPTLKKKALAKPPVKDPPEDERVPLHPSLLTNPYFITILAHTYRNNNPDMSEETAKKAAEYSAKKLYEQVSDGGSVDSGPIYDVAVKLLGLSIMKALWNSYDSAENENKIKKQITLLKQNEVSQTLNWHTTDQDSKTSNWHTPNEPTASLDRLDLHISETNPQETESRMLTASPSATVVSVALIEKSNQATKDQVKAEGESILPDDNSALVIKPPPLIPITRKKRGRPRKHPVKASKKKIVKSTTDAVDQCKSRTSTTKSNIGSENSSFSVVPMPNSLINNFGEAVYIPSHFNSTLSSLETVSKRKSSHLKVVAAHTASRVVPMPNSLVNSLGDRVTVSLDDKNTQKKSEAASRKTATRVMADPKSLVSNNVECITATQPTVSTKENPLVPIKPSSSHEVTICLDSDDEEEVQILGTNIINNLESPVSQSKDNAPILPPTLSTQSNIASVLPQTSAIQNVVSERLQKLLPVNSENDCYVDLDEIPDTESVSVNMHANILVEPSAKKAPEQAACSKVIPLSFCDVSAEKKTNKKQMAEATVKQVICTDKQPSAGPQKQSSDNLLKQLLDKKKLKPADNLLIPINKEKGSAIPLPPLETRKKGSTVTNVKPNVDVPVDMEVIPIADDDDPFDSLVVIEKTKIETQSCKNKIFRDAPVEPVGIENKNKIKSKIKNASENINTPTPTKAAPAKTVIATAETLHLTPLKVAASTPRQTPPLDKFTTTKAKRYSTDINQSFRVHGSSGSSSSDSSRPSSPTMSDSTQSLLNNVIHIPAALYTDEVNTTKGLSLTLKSEKSNQEKTKNDLKISSSVPTKPPLTELVLKKSSTTVGTSPPVKKVNTYSNKTRKAGPQVVGSIETTTTSNPTNTHRSSSSSSDETSVNQLSKSNFLSMASNSKESKAKLVLPRISLKETSQRLLRTVDLTSINEGGTDMSGKRRQSTAGPTVVCNRERLLGMVDLTGDSKPAVPKAKITGKTVSGTGSTIIIRAKGASSQGANKKTELTVLSHVIKESLGAKLKVVHMTDIKPKLSSIAGGSSASNDGGRSKRKVPTPSESCDSKRKKIDKPMTLEDFTLDDINEDDDIIELE